MWAVNKNKRPAWRTELSFLLLRRCCSLTPQLPLTLTGNSESKLAQSLMTTQVSFPNNAQLSCSVCSKCTFFGGVFFGHLWLHLWLWCNEEMCVQVRTCLSPPYACLCCSSTHRKDKYIRNKRSSAATAQHRQGGRIYVETHLASAITFPRLSLHHHLLTEPEIWFNVTLYLLFMRQYGLNFHNKENVGHHFWYLSQRAALHPVWLLYNRNLQADHQTSSLHCWSTAAWKQCWLKKRLA